MLEGGVKAVRRMKNMIRILVVAVIFYLSIPSSVFAQDYLNINLLSKSGLDASGIDEVFAGTPLEGLGKDFVQVEEETGVNSQFLASLAIHESGWGRSRIAREKNNLFGFGAYDRAPYKYARTFNSKSDGIRTVAFYVRKNYLTEGEKYFNGANIAGMNKDYSSDPGWKVKISNQMKRFEPYLPSEPQTQPESVDEKKKKEKKSLDKSKKNKRKEANEMTTDDILISVVGGAIAYPKIALAIVLMLLVLVLRKRFAVLKMITAPVVVLIWAIFSFLAGVTADFLRSLCPNFKESVVEVFWPKLKEEKKEAKELFKDKRESRKEVKRRAKERKAMLSKNSEKALA